jgi:hypothetical protein
MMGTTIAAILAILQGPLGQAFGQSLLKLIQESAPDVTQQQLLAMAGEIGAVIILPPGPPDAAP